MPWIRLDDQFPDHPKVVAAGPVAAWLYVCGIGYCNRLLTDGLIPRGQVRKLADVENATELADQLVKVGLWEEVEDGYRIHDFLEYQPSAEQVKAERSMNKTRKELYADPFLVKEVKRRDGDHCRYCYKYVRWTDRKSAQGGTFDHVIPDGGNSLDNLVVACRGCNSGKGQRTPEQANMVLRPPFGTGTSSDLVPTKTESIHPYPSRTPTPVNARSNTDSEAHSERERSRPLADAPTPAPKRRAKRAATPPPDTFPITVEMEEWADATCPEIDLDIETRRFLDSAHSKGREYVDWFAAWRGWMTNDYPKAMKGGKATRASPNGQHKNGFVAAMERHQGKDRSDGSDEFPEALDAAFSVGPAHRRQQPGGD
jgi:hypothetical protein